MSSIDTRRDRCGSTLRSNCQVRLNSASFSATLRNSGLTCRLSTISPSPCAMLAGLWSAKSRPPRNRLPRQTCILLHHHPECKTAAIAEVPRSRKLSEGTPQACLTLRRGCRTSPNRPYARPLRDHGRLPLARVTDVLRTTLLSVAIRSTTARMASSRRERAFLSSAA